MAVGGKGRAVGGGRGGGGDDRGEWEEVQVHVAGLMAEAPGEEVAAKAAAMGQAMTDCGCHLNNAYMQHSLLALVVIPELRISDLGLVDVRKFELLPVLRKEGQDADA